MELLSSPFVVDYIYESFITLVKQDSLRPKKTAAVWAALVTPADLHPCVH